MNLDELKKVHELLVNAQHCIDDANQIVLEAHRAIITKPYALKRVKRYINIYASGSGELLFDTKEKAERASSDYGFKKFGRYLHTAEIEIEVPA